MIPGRISLLVTLLLCLVNLFVNITSLSPHADSLTSIAAWLIACMLFVTGNLVEYGMILLSWKYYAATGKMDMVQKLYKKLDLIALVLSVIFFLMFNFAFWTKALDKSSDAKTDSGF